MHENAITIPDRLRSKALNVDRGRKWLTELPAVCARLGDEWSVELGSAYADCHISLVVAANRGSRPVALKVPMPPAIELGTLAAGARANEANALRTWGGDGAVQLLEYDHTTGAMLIERCMPGTALDNHDDPDCVAARLLRRLHRTQPSGSEFEHVADRADRFVQELPMRFEAAGAPFDRWLLDTAVELFGQLARPGPVNVLLHGDFHHENILSAQRERWLAVDPLPMFGDPAYDAVQYLLFRKGDLTDPATQWVGVIDEFCDRLDLDAERVKAWTFARLVSDALASCLEGAPSAELEAWQGDLWTARLIHRLRE